MLYSEETLPVVQQHNSPLAVHVFQMNCLRCICGIPLLGRTRVPNVDILIRRHTFSVESQVQKQKTRVVRSYLQDAR